MTTTFLHLLEQLIPSTTTGATGLSDAELDRSVGFAAFWAFGGTVSEADRDRFTAWWLREWPGLFAESLGDPWLQFVDAETRDFVTWKDHVPQFTGARHDERLFVSTPHLCALTYALGLLMDAGRSCVVAGPRGSGKSELVRERVAWVTGGEVAEVEGVNLMQPHQAQPGRQ